MYGNIMQYYIFEADILHESKNFSRVEQLGKLQQFWVCRQALLETEKWAIA